MIMTRGRKNASSQWIINHKRNLRLVNMKILFLRDYISFNLLICPKKHHSTLKRRKRMKATIPHSYIEAVQSFEVSNNIGHALNPRAPRHSRFEMFQKKFKPGQLLPPKNMRSKPTGISPINSK